MPHNPFEAPQRCDFNRNAETERVSRRKPMDSLLLFGGSQQVLNLCVAELLSQDQKKQHHAAAWFVRMKGSIR